MDTENTLSSPPVSVRILKYCWIYFKNNMIDDERPVSNSEYIAECYNMHDKLAIPQKSTNKFHLEMITTYELL